MSDSTTRFGDRAGDYAKYRPSYPRDAIEAVVEGFSRPDVADLGAGTGISTEELERRLAVRRRQTALLSYVLFLMACAFVLAWARVALRTVSGGGRVVLLLQFLPFCVLFYLMSFYQALINFQIRTGRTANWREYLTTEDGFLPRW